MKSHTYYIISGILALLLFVSCGQQYHAENTVEAFVEANMEQHDKIMHRDYADIGKTRHINDSVINVMRQRGAQGFKKDITYGQMPEGDLFYLRMRYVLEGDTLQNTFYLNHELTEVIAFK
ncbi:MAG: hypothetical protein IJJ56_10095 [Prevotella sp.]|nr:hypothetical protein [Prevotella sp.]